MPQIYTKAGNAIPTAVADAAQVQVRSDEFGALHVRSELMAWAAEGSYFRATNATFGTGIAAAVTTAWSATAAFLAMRNGSATKAVIPHYMRFINTAAGASTTSSRIAIALDTATRYSSGGSDLLARIFNANSALAPSSVVDQLFAGAVVASAAVAAKYVGNVQLKTQATPCWVVGDEVMLNFFPTSFSGGAALNGTAATLFTKGIGPVVLKGQNHSLLVHWWNPANAATPPSWEIEMAWWER